MQLPRLARGSDFAGKPSCPGSRLRAAPRTGREHAKHEAVKHTAGEYVRNKTIRTYTVEGYFSIFKRGMIGVYQHCGEKHLERYITEFDFRYNARQITDAERADKALQGIGGKRLTYRRANGEESHP